MKKIICGGLLLIIIIAGCEKEKITQNKEKIEMPVEVMRAEKSSIEKVISYVGDIKAQEEIVIYSKVPGKLIENKVKEGDKVKKGDVLALIDRDEVGFKFEEAPVISPIDGIVGRIDLDRGTHIRPVSNMSSGTPVALVVDMDAMRVRINVIERDFPKIKKGQRAEIRVDAYPGEIFIGEVDFIRQVIDIVSRTATVEIDISNPRHRLKSGMFARVEIVASMHENVLVVPIRAIICREGKEILFVVEGNSAGIREVKTGLNDGNRVEVVSGLSEGEKVIVEGCYGLKDGAGVKTK